MNQVVLNIWESPIKSKNELHTLLSDESNAILNRIKKMNDRYFFRKDADLTNKLQTISPIDLTNILNVYFAEAILDQPSLDPDKLLDRLSQIIPLEKLQETVQGHIPDVLKEVKGTIEEAKYYLTTTKSNGSPSLKSRLNDVLDVIVSILETILNSFGLKTLLERSQSEIKDQFKAQKIMMLLHLFTMITSMILPIIGVTVAGVIIGSVFLFISLLSIFWSKINPMPNFLPGEALNLTREVQQGKFIPQGRKESMDEMANILKMGRHPILVGPSRVGKSLTAKSFAQAVERGDYPELKGFKVFRINTADIIAHKPSYMGGGNRILNQISEAMGRHRNKIILVLDEVHMACKNDEKIAEQLKTFLDEAGEFPHVVGITTKKEYKEYVKNNVAFSLRFDKVKIKNTDKNETLKILGDLILKSKSKPFINEETLSYIYEKSITINKAPQPTTAIKILQRCINKVEKSQITKTQLKITKISSEILSLNSQAAAYGNSKKELKEKIETLKSQLEALQELALKEKSELTRLYNLKDTSNQLMQKFYQYVVKISNISLDSIGPKNQTQVSKFLLFKEYFSKNIRSYLITKSGSVGSKLLIDKTLIDEVCANI